MRKEEEEVCVRERHTQRLRFVVDAVVVARSFLAVSGPRVR